MRGMPLPYWEPAGTVSEEEQRRWLAAERIATDEYLAGRLAPPVPSASLC